MTKRRICLLMTCMLLAVTGCTSSVEEGSTLLEEKKYEEAQEKFQEAVEDNKDLDEAYRGLGYCFYEQEEYEEALNSFEQALNAGTKETAVLYNLSGICAMKLEEYRKSTYYFEEGRSFSEVSEELWKEMTLNLVVTYEQLEEYQLAKETLEEYLSKYPDEEDVRKELEFLNTQL